jgi:maltose O-acetyltransferase
MALAALRTSSMIESETMNSLIKVLHLRGLWKCFCLFATNHIFTGMGTFSSRIKRTLLNSCGNKIGNGTTIVSPIILKGSLVAGNECWINCGFTIHGNGTVYIGNNCDIGPDVIFLTGGHEIGDKERRAGEGETYTVRVGNGVWIGARSTILGNVHLSEGCVIAACACVTKDVPEDTIVGGVPAKLLRRIEDEGLEIHKGNTEKKSS